MPTHIPLERGGAGAAVVCFGQLRVLIVEPTSLNRGEGLMAKWWFRASCGGKVVARVIVVVEE